MPGRTKAYRLFLQNKFAIDLSQRCQAELRYIINKNNKVKSKILEDTRVIMTTIKQCYAGNHSLCKQNSSVCKAETDDNWLQKSVYLTKTFKINIKKWDHEQTLMEVIEYRLGDDTISLTRLNTNTQKVEGTNRAIKRSLPKDKTFSRNFEARAHSALHSVNNGPGNSLRKLCLAAGCTIPSGSGPDLQLRSLQLESEQKKKREMSIAFKIKRKIKKQRLFQLYEKHREQKHYIKNQLTRFLNKRKAKPNAPLSEQHTDHNIYARQSLRRQKTRLHTSKNTGRRVAKAGPKGNTLSAARVNIVSLKGEMFRFNTCPIVT